jgi:hypothetical protein
MAAASRFGVSLKQLRDLMEYRGAEGIQKLNELGGVKGLQAKLNTSEAGGNNSKNYKKYPKNYFCNPKLLLSAFRSAFAAPSQRLRSTFTAPSQRLRSAFAAPSQRLCSAFTAPSQRLRSAFAAPSQRLRSAFASPLQRLRSGLRPFLKNISREI